MPELIVNLDSVAMLREACRALEPDPVQVAAVAEAAGAAGISVQLREDRRHVQDRDTRVLKETVKTSFMLAIVPSEPLLLVAEALKPDWVTLVPAGAGVSGAGVSGRELSGRDDGLRPAVESLRRAGIRVGLLVQPDLDLVKLAAGLGVQGVSLHAGSYAARFGSPDEQREIEALQNAAEYAQKLGLRARVAEGVDFRNGGPLFAMGAVQAFEVGHALMARAMLVGIGEAVRELIGLMRSARPAVPQYRA
jgi:pyridoxine 5-phosphate synthase